MDSCPICYDPIRYPACANPCNHMFCEPCINKWMLKKNTCPVCRTKCSLYTDEPQKGVKCYFGSDKNLYKTSLLLKGF